MRSMGRMCFCSAIGCLLGMLVRGWGLKVDRYSWMITVAGMFFGERESGREHLLQHLSCENWVSQFQDLRNFHLGTCSTKSGEIWHAQTFFPLRMMRFGATMTGNKMRIAVHSVCVAWRSSLSSILILLVQWDGYVAVCCCF